MYFTVMPGYTYQFKFLCKNYKNSNDGTLYTHVYVCEIIFEHFEVK